MSINYQKKRIEAELEEINAAAEKGETEPVDEKYSGWAWYQISEEESLVFGLQPADMPRLATVHELYYCAIEVVYTRPEEEVVEMRAELPWLSSGIVDKGEWVRFAELFGIGNRQAEAMFSKYEYWEEREGLVQYGDEKNEDKYLNAEVDWGRESSGRWVFAKRREPIACLIPNEEHPGWYVTDIFTPFPKLGHASVDCISREEGQEVIENWWGSVKLYLERGWLKITDEGKFMASDTGRPHFEAADVPICGL